MFFYGFGLKEQLLLFMCTRALSHLLRSPKGSTKFIKIQPIGHTPDLSIDRPTTI